MLSSADDLMDLLSEQFSAAPSHKSGSSKHRSGSGSSSGQHWSIDKVANSLNIEMDDAEQVEGNVLLSALSGKKFFAFDNHTVEQIPRRELLTFYFTLKILIRYKKGEGGKVYG